MEKLTNQISNPIGERKVSEVAGMIGFISADWELGIKTGKQVKPFILFSFCNNSNKLKIAKRIFNNSAKNN
jgi:hypothetical protein